MSAMYRRVGFERFKIWERGTEVRRSHWKNSGFRNQWCKLYNVRQYINVRITVREFSTVARSPAHTLG